MKVRLLGTGTPTPSLRREARAYLVDIENDVMVIDHRLGACRRLLDAGGGADLSQPSTAVTNASRVNASARRLDLAAT